MKQTKREILVDAIIEYAWDEFENYQDYIKLAKKSESELYEELQSILEYFKEEELERFEEIQKILEHTITI